jgi:hypothetical protein
MHANKYGSGTGLMTGPNEKFEKTTFGAAMRADSSVQASTSGSRVSHETFISIHPREAG